MIGARNLDLCRALDSFQCRGACVRVLQHQRKIALAVYIEDRHAQFAWVGEFAAADSDG